MEANLSGKLRPGGGLVRVPSTKSRVGSVSSQAAVKPEKRSLSNTYNKETDNNIFALGDAASNLDNLDDLFAGFGFNLMDILTGDGPPIAQMGTTEVLDHNSTETSENALCTREGVGQEKAVDQVHTSTKTLPDGRRVHTRVVRGPPRCTKRIIRISRETPNGTELLSTMELEPGKEFTLPGGTIITPTLEPDNDHPRPSVTARGVTSPSTTVCIDRPAQDGPYISTLKHGIVSRPQESQKPDSVYNLPRVSVANRDPGRGVSPTNANLSGNSNHVDNSQSPLLSPSSMALTPTTLLSSPPNSPWDNATQKRRSIWSSSGEDDIQVEFRLLLIHSYNNWHNPPDKLPTFVLSQIEHSYDNTSTSK